MPRDLDWDGCRNVRDLGGFATPAGTTAFGVFVRSDNARELTPAGWRAASEYGIRAVLDLRSDPECAADPPAHPGFAHRRLSLFGCATQRHQPGARGDGGAVRLGRGISPAGRRLRACGA